MRGREFCGANTNFGKRHEHGIPTTPTGHGGDAGKSETGAGTCVLGVQTLAEVGHAQLGAVGRDWHVQADAAAVGFPLAAHGGDRLLRRVACEVISYPIP